MIPLNMSKLRKYNKPIKNDNICKKRSKGPWHGGQGQQLQIINHHKKKETKGE